MILARKQNFEWNESIFHRSTCFHLRKYPSSFSNKRPCVQDHCQCYQLWARKINSNTHTDNLPDKMDMLCLHIHTHKHTLALVHTHKPVLVWIFCDEYRFSQRESVCVCVVCVCGVCVSSNILLQWLTDGVQCLAVNVLSECLSVCQSPVVWRLPVRV